MKTIIACMASRLNHNDSIVGAENEARAITRKWKSTIEQSLQDLTPPLIPKGRVKKALYS